MTRKRPIDHPAFVSTEELDRALKNLPPKSVVVPKNVYQYGQARVACGLRVAYEEVQAQRLAPRSSETQQTDAGTSIR